MSNHIFSYGGIARVVQERQPGTPLGKEKLLPVHIHQRQEEISVQYIIGPRQLPMGPPLLPLYKILR